MRRAACAALLALLSSAGRLAAQVDPTGRWQTIRTEHFRVHFRAETERLARRAAVEAERAYTGLSQTLHPPRGPLDLLVSDDVDFSNGFATTFPSNRIVVYAHPPLEAGSLRFYDDWLTLVITHELTHVFHLDRTRGIWRGLQGVFGRHPGLFPNAYVPRWFTEGLAVYYETALTGSGRLAGSQHRMIARAGLLEPGGARRLDELSLSTSRYPSGDIAYVNGSLLLEQLARDRGPAAVGKVIERASASLLPSLLGLSTGVNWTAAWQALRDTLMSDLGSAGAPIPGWREVGGGGRGIANPRWIDSATIVYSGERGNAVAGLYGTATARADAKPFRIGRRNSLDASTRLPDSSLVFAQLDFSDRYHIRSDLWREQHGTQTQLTFGARLAQVDARASDGRLAATEYIAGSSRIVTLRVDSAVQRAVLTSGTIDTNWAEPRWSPDGSRIVAVRWRRGGLTALVEIDPLTGAQRVRHESRAVNSAPAWLRDGALVFASDIDGRSQLYSLAPSDSTPMRLSNTATGMFDPAPSPDGALLAATQYRVDGYHLGLVTLPLPGTPMPRATPTPPRRQVPDVDSSTAPSTPYRALRQLIPRYWEPRLESGQRRARLYGFYTQAEDMLNRHAYRVEVLRDSRTNAMNHDASYAYRGFGQPAISVGTASHWLYGPLTNSSDVVIGELRQRSRAVSMALSLARPRFRTASSFSLGATYQQYQYFTSPRVLIQTADPFYRTTPAFPVLFVVTGFSNVKRPALSISAEDGVQVSTTLEQDWARTNDPVSSRRGIVDVRGYRGFDFGSAAHHVLALRTAFGVADRKALGLFSAGGGSGSTVEIVPGYSIGGNRRTFSARGFLPGSQSGTRAVAAAAEVRLPIASPSRGLGFLPVFIDRVSATTFVETAGAWCQRASAPKICEGRLTMLRGMTSAGGEIVLDAAPRFDFLYRFRLGIAQPLTTGGLRSKPGTNIYIDFGTYF